MSIRKTSTLQHTESNLPTLTDFEEFSVENMYAKIYHVRHKMLTAQINFNASVETHMDKGTPGLDLTDAIGYHYGQFPPANLDYARLITPITDAASALARYEQMLREMHNSELLLAPLRRQEALVSSRMEGTITTFDELLRYEADQDSDDPEPRQDVRNDTIEVFFYQRAMRQAQQMLQEGAPFSEWMIRSAHKSLLSFGRGADKRPGEYKTDQNYLADTAKKKVLFIPISPERVNDGMQNLMHYVDENPEGMLIKIAISHVEFEALHPFNDGNGRIGRMIITLLLWKYGVISAPHFYISGYLEQKKNEYIDKMRSVSARGEWTEWCIFFLRALEAQAMTNLETAENIRELYNEMRETFRVLLASQWSVNALDFIFSQPVFRNNKFTNNSGIPRHVASRFARILVENGLLKTVYPAAGRRPAMYAFEPLLRLVRA